MNIMRKSNEAASCSFFEGLGGRLSRKHVRTIALGRAARVLRPVFALVLVVLIVPLTTSSLLGQSYDPPAQQGPPPPPQSGMDSEQGPPPPPPDQGDGPGEGTGQSQGQPQGEPMSPEQLGQLVAPIALYPDALVAQVLAASTYPTQVVQADRWLLAKGDLPAAQLAAAANDQSWDPSVKALVAFPSVLAQMDKNIQWTTDLGNAYYNQPDDVMSAIQTMRGRAQTAGNLRSTSQQQVSEDDGNIMIAPEDPEVVYVPTYDPWAVYGEPIDVFPGYYYGPPAGVYIGSGLAIGFGIGIGIGVYSHWGWGYHRWGFNWRDRAVLYNRGRYYTHSRTVYNRGWNRPGSPYGRAGMRGAYNRGGNFNRGGGSNHGGNFNRGGNYNRGAQGNTQNRNNNRGNQNFNRGVQNNDRGNQNFNRGAQNNNRGNQNFNRGAQNNDRGNQNFNRGAQNSNRGGHEVRSDARSSGGGSFGGGQGGSRGGGGRGDGGHGGGHGR